MFRTIALDMFIFKSFVWDYTLESLIKVQYEMTKRGISLTESNNLPLFEFDSYFDLICKDIKEEIESFEE